MKHFWELHNKRRPFPALYEAAKQFGDRIYFAQPKYVEDGQCKWCGKKLPKNRKSFCCDDCSAAWGRTTVWGRGRSAYSLRILHRDNFTCKRCGKFMAFKNTFGVYIPIDDVNADAQVHHLIPVSMGGDDSPENLVSLCGECHREIHRQINATGALWFHKNNNRGGE